ncbi:glutathione S-transferase family protein [Mesorhizobium sp.]|uniref:glutathione S-transferase family protein n=1 Tax=Mesorhizobium sp. TaxID=1871066 RepID=UPI000FE6A456|nr:glutathione S-transferase family protein [Mesorhizobium sp.]RWK66795.1 MAG: glutathione S-transferase family protein [Mesorhizobium sp.]
MADVHFIAAEVCPFAQRTHLTLLEKGIEFDHSEVNLRDKPAWFEAISPYSKVPVLKRGNDVIYESAIINEYLEELYPEPPLLPADPGQRAMARIWIDYSNTKFTVRFYRVLLEKDPDRRRALTGEVVTQLEFMEDAGLAKLGADPYWLGKELSLVDIDYYPHFERFAVLTHYRGIEIPARCTRLKRWLAAMRERDSVKATMHSDEYHIASYAAYADGSASGTTARDMRTA